MDIDIVILCGPFLTGVDFVLLLRLVSILVTMTTDNIA